MLWNWRVLRNIKYISGSKKPKEPAEYELAKSLVTLERPPRGQTHPKPINNFPTPSNP